MESIGLIITKFSDELIAAQFAAMCISLSLAIYWMLIRKKKKESSEWVSSALVRAYLDRVRAEEREIRIKLFGEDAGVPVMVTPMHGLAGASSAEADALRAQLMMSDQKTRDLEKLMASLNAEKAAMELKLKNAPAAGTANNAANDAAMAALKQQLSDLQAKLDEYGVIEDDLANLKKIQKENEQLKQQIGNGKPGGGAQLNLVQGGAAAPATPAAAVAPTPAVAATISATPAEVEAAKSVANDSMAEKIVAELSAAPAPNTAGMLSQEGVDDLFNQLSASLNPGANAGAATAAAPVAAAAPAAEGKAKEDELLSEFEKMLAS